MKKIVLITSLCLFAGFSFAQKKAVKQAKVVIEKTDEARGLIKPALTDEETAEDQETWKVAGDIEYKAFEKEYDAEMTKEMMKTQGANENNMYGALYNMVDYYVKADELGQLPDQKGKVKNKVRKDIVKNFRTSHHLYINGGAYFNDKGIQASKNGNEDEAKKNFSRASDFFEMYCLIPDLPMFEGEKEPLAVKDSTYQEMKYYAATMAVQAKDSKRSIQLLEALTGAPYIPNSVYEESTSLELLAVEYNRSGDSVKYVRVLEEGATKYPRNNFFTPNLINEYIRAEQADKAMDHLDQAIKNDPDSRCELLSVKGSLQASSEKYEDAIKSYQEAIAADPACERALEGLGVLYVVQAQNLREKATQETNRLKMKEFDDQAVELYKKSLPLLEKYVEILRAKKADKYELRPALNKLHNVYYNLSALNVPKDAEFEAIDAEINAMNEE